MIIAISRDRRFSPNREEADAALFSAVCAKLTLRKESVSCMTEEEFAVNGISTRSKCDAIFHMTRSAAALQRLRKLAAAHHVPIINSPESIMACRPAIRASILRKEAFNPESKSSGESGLRFPLWIKRGDAHACCGSDIRFITDRMELHLAIKEFENRGLLDYIIQEHKPGCLLKLYGVGDEFFHCHRVTERAQGKFGLESHNDLTGSYSYDKEELRRVACKARALIGVTTYGADAIISPQGEISIIDFNDSPSFTPCREEAAGAIANILCQIK